MFPDDRPYLSLFPHAEHGEEAKAEIETIRAAIEQRIVRGAEDDVEGRARVWLPDRNSSSSTADDMYNHFPSLGLAIREHCSLHKERRHGGVLEGNVVESETHEKSAHESVVLSKLDRELDERILVNLNALLVFPGAAIVQMSCTCNENRQLDVFWQDEISFARSVEYPE
mmetsp:Transcript_20139/g.80976  ORF Transcript_20139/g.80976 Transcript_20139/m.80976 type:complete len:170 (-) Transcript_20139:561-1070(-)